MYCQGTDPGRNEDMAAHRVRDPGHLHSLYMGWSCSDKNDSADGLQDKACLHQREEDGCTSGSDRTAPGMHHRETMDPKGSRPHPLGMQWG